MHQARLSLFSRLSGCLFLAIGASAPLAANEAHASEPSAEPAPTITWSGQIRPRLELRNGGHFTLSPEELNYAQPARLDHVSQRARLGVAVERGSLSTRLQLQYASFWGLTGGASLTDPSLGIHQALITYTPVEWLHLDVGRFEIGYGDERVLGSVGWHQVGRAWDGLRLRFKPITGLDADVLALQYREGAVSSAPDAHLEQDAYLTGLYLSGRELLAPAFSAFDVYTLYDVQLEGLGESPQRRQLMTSGLRLAGKWGPGSATIEGAYQLGKACQIDGTAGDTTCLDDTSPIGAWFFDSEFGFALPLDVPIRLVAGFSIATGDDPGTDRIEAYNQLYPTAHRWLGRMDVIGPRSNVREIRAGFSANLWGFDLHHRTHDFTRIEPTTERVGLELNTWVDRVLTPGLAMSLGHGLFAPDEGMTRNDAEPTGVAHWAYLQMTASF
jgi:hypothetical protein